MAGKFKYDVPREQAELTVLISKFCVHIPKMKDFWENVPDTTVYSQMNLKLPFYALVF